MVCNSFYAAMVPSVLFAGPLIGLPYSVLDIFLDKPRLENQTFRFLDRKSSTTHAKGLGHNRYSSLSRTVSAISR
jgi:hypothetical protein